jgi:hypothetical protein
MENHQINCATINQIRAYNAVIELEVTLATVIDQWSMVTVRWSLAEGHRFVLKAKCIQ